MDRDDFIIAVYLIVYEHYQAIQKQYRIRRGCFAPTLTDEEVITMEICGEYFKLGCDKDLYAYFHAHYLHFFPKLTDRSVFVRQAANLWQVKAAMQKRLVIVNGQMKDPVQVIDTLPVPVYILTRATRDHCFKTEADFGYCAAKDLHYYGFKLGVRISRLGMITYYPLLAARPHDIQSLDILLEGFEGMTPADKVFIDEYRQSRLLEQHGIRMVILVRKNMQKSDLPEYLSCFSANASGSLSKRLARI